jgi:hypothetical protein
VFNYESMPQKTFKAFFSHQRRPHVVTVSPRRRLLANHLIRTGRSSLILHLLECSDCDLDVLSPDGPFHEEHALTGDDKRAMMTSFRYPHGLAGYAAPPE